MNEPKTVLRILCALLLLLVTVVLIADALGEGMLTIRQVHASGGLHVRQAPSLDAWICFTLDDRTTVSVLETANGWSMIALNNAPLVPFGWVCSDYLK